MATVKFRIRPKENPNRETAIHCYYYHEGIEIELSTGLKVLPANWANSRVTTPKNKINKLLTDRESALRNLHIDHQGKSKSELEALATSIIKGKPVQLKHTEDPTQKKTSLFTVGRFIVQCARELTPKTVKGYKTVWRVLSIFQKGKRLDFAAFDMSFHDRFKNFLYDTPNPNYVGYGLVYDSSVGAYIVTPGAGDPIGLFDDTVFRYIIILHTICDWAKKRGYVVHPSYHDWPIIKRKYKKINLNKVELEAIEALPKMGNLTIKRQRGNKRVSNFNINLDHVRDYISILCRSGQRISDVKKFDAVQVVDDSWKFTQRKGNRTTVKVMSIPLRGFCSPIKFILEKYNYKLPKMSEQMINLGIKEVALRAGITQPMFIERWAGSKKIRVTGTKNEFLSSHSVGKKSFINILSNDGISTKAISDITGTSEKTIRDNYQDRLEEKTLIDYLEKVEPTKSVMRIAN